MSAKSLLIISAHADDNISCAGTVMKLVKNQGFVPYEVVLTNSQLGQDFKNATEIPVEIVARTRAKELSRAQKFLGIKSSFLLNQPDLGLTYSQQLVFSVVGVIRKIKPQIVFLPNSYDAHPDHQAAYRIGLSALKVAAWGVKKQSLGPPWRTPLVLCAEGMLPIKSQILVDVTDFMAQKIRLFKIYSSQASPKAVAFEKSLATVRGYHLRKPNSFYAEAFSLQEEFPVLLFE